MTKFRIYYDKDKETAWLNDMAAKGYAMKSFFAGFYTFEKCEPGEYIYQIDFGSKMFAIDPNYREFMEENDVEVLQPWGMWIILRKKAALGDFVLYTDVDSNIEHYTKIINMFKIALVIELICFFMECAAFYGGFQAGLYFMILIGIFIVSFISIIAKTNRTIAELKSRKGIECNQKPMNQSPALISGMMLNCMTLCLPETISDYIKIPLQIFAIILMLYGIYQCRHLFSSK